MKWFAETTEWSDSATPNGIYLLDDSKTKMYAFRPRGTGDIKVFKNAIKIETRGRKFVVNPVQFKTGIKEEELEGRTWTVAGSKGAEYTVTELNGQLSCTCPASKWSKGDCKHIAKFKAKTA